MSRNFTSWRAEELSHLGDAEAIRDSCRRSLPFEPSVTVGLRRYPNRVPNRPTVRRNSVREARALERHNDIGARFQDRRCLHAEAHDYHEVSGEGLAIPATLRAATEGPPLERAARPILLHGCAVGRGRIRRVPHYT